MAMDDNAVVILISSDDDDDYEASKPDAKKRKGMALEEKTAAAERSGPPGGVRAEMTVKVGSVKTRRRLIKRKRKKMMKRTMKNQTNCAPQHEIADDAPEKKGEAKLILISDNDTPQKLLEGKQVDSGQSIKMLKLDGTKLVQKSKNIVLQKLLRGPRYFDPFERNREMCFHCGEEGHKTFKCTSKKRTKPCFVCAGFGHNGMSCKQGQECFNCKGLGHYANKCPNKIEENLPISNICLRCGDSGHDMWTCNSDYSHDDIKEIQCHVCKKFGHLCCVDYPDLGSRQISCCNCGQSGHVGSECAKVDEKPSGSRYSISCRKFKERGHSAHKFKEHAKVERAQRISKEERVSLGSKSAPHDLKKAKKNIKIPYEERASATAFQPRWRNERNMDGRRTLCYRDMSVSSSSRNLWSPRESFQRFNRPATPGSQAYQPARNNQVTSASGNYFIPPNPFQMFNSLPPPFPGSQVSLPTLNNQETSTLLASGNLFIPQNPFQMFNSPPFPGSQVYLPAKNNQETSTLPAVRNFSIPQNHVQMYNHTSPGSQAHQAIFYPPWSGNFSFGHMR